MVTVSAVGLLLLIPLAFVMFFLLWFFINLTREFSPRRRRASQKLYVTRPGRGYWE